MRSQSHVRSITRAAIVLAAIAIAVACSSSKTSSNSTSSGGGDTGTVAAQNPATALAKAEAATKVNFKGNYTNVSPESRPAAKNKSVIIISASQASISSSVPANGAAEAAKKLGWKVTIYDAKLEPSKYAPLVRQAVTAKPDGIILVAIDCQNVQQPLQQAKNAGIKVVGHLRLRLQRRPRRWRLVRALQRLDQLRRQGRQHRQVHRVLRRRPGPVHHRCDRRTRPRSSPSRTPSSPCSTTRSRASRDTINASGGSKIVDTLNVTSSDITTGKIQAKMQAELLQPPRGQLGEEPLHLRHAARHRPGTRCQGRQAARDGRRGLRPRARPHPPGQGHRGQHHLVGVGRLGRGRHAQQRRSWARIRPTAASAGSWPTRTTTCRPPRLRVRPAVDFKAEYKKAWGVS